MMAMMPTTAWASDLSTFANPYNIFSWEQRGQGVIHITVLENQRNNSGKTTVAAFHQGAIWIEDPMDSKKRIKIIDCQEYDDNGSAKGTSNMGCLLIKCLVALGFTIRRH